MVRTGRTLAKSPNSSRSRTLTERKPPPTGVVSGPLSASRVRRMLSSVSCGSGSPPLASAAMPAIFSSQAKGAASAPSTSFTASTISGPMPSPGMRVVGIAFFVVSLVMMRTLLPVWVPPARPRSAMRHRSPRRDALACAMVVRTIVQYPDARLRAVAAPVAAFDDTLRALAADLIDTMRAAEGIGITAPHIGVTWRVVALALSPEAGPQIYVNPEIVWASEERLQHEEGSVSMAGVTAEIARAARIRLRYRDVTGAEQSEAADGLRAV